jgi:hypothetical protein
VEVRRANGETGSFNLAGFAFLLQIPAQIKNIDGGNMKQNLGWGKTMRQLGNISYIIGAAMLIASLLTSFIPPTVVEANNPSSPLKCEATNTPKTPTKTTVPPTNTPVPPTNTPVPPTNTPVPPTNTPISPTPSNTPETPTSTNTPVTPSPTSSNTPETPTSTYTPETPSPTPSETPETPTATPTITFTPSSTSTGTITPTYTPSITPTNTSTDTPEPPTSTPTITATFHDPFSLEFYCTGFIVVNNNDFQASYEWNISGGPSGTGLLQPFGSVAYDTAYYPGVVSLYSGGVLMAAGYLPTNCGKDEKTPTPPVRTPRTPVPTRTPHDPTKVVKTLIPPVITTPDILIPVTGVDLGGSNSLQRMLFSLGLSFLGLGLVLNGLARNRKDLGI